MKHSATPLISRRRLLALAGTGLAVGRLDASTEFWNRKDPSQWTAAELKTLLTHSPWAREVHAEYMAGAVLGCSGGGQAPHGGWSEHAPVGPIGARLPKGGRVKSAFVGKVLWESADPIRDARKSPLPESVAQHYVIRVSDFPAPGEPDCAASTAGESLDNLKEFATLEKKPVGTAHAAVVLRQASTTFLFAFLKAALPLSVSDGEVTFTTHLDRLIIEAKFNLKDMNYRNRLAV